MPSTPTFTDLAVQLAADGAGGSCADAAAGLEARARYEDPHRADALRRAARGLRIASRLLDGLSLSLGPAPFRPIGLRGAVAAGHVALAAGRAAQAELIGQGASEAAPDAAAGPRLVGAARFAQGRFAGAAEAFRDAVALEPGDRDARALLAEALLFAGERQKAAAMLLDLGPRGGGDLASTLREALCAGAYANSGRLR
jgi:tetratricopeptide (TPR) repeat protein